ncbi:hypothetical protein PMO31116_01783 [Pandoraea morbifera]|uniref:DUF2894 domain-containing protein n=1 Tax=Pandoraea morbifera TaxID=2508300 RepID=A0A5E4U485_9BURK|nr:DUF2894 domain-containing protein [Pandoraea morbifera]VVD94541.1 hypothetical protein PMO31116_01783 [Pandoraea morbifera]
MSDETVMTPPGDATVPAPDERDVRGTHDGRGTAAADAQTGTGREAHDIEAQLAAWRARGADKRDPVRFHRIEALARRRCAYDASVQRVLDARLAALIDAFAESVSTADDGGAANAAWPAPSCSTAPDAPAASPLCALTAEMARRADANGRSASAPASRAARGVSTVAPSASAPPATGQRETRDPEVAAQRAAPVPVAITPTVIATDDAFEDLDVLEYFRETWSKLSTDGNLRQSLAQVPENAGPLNSNHLVHRALSLMHDVSPDYLRHFLRHADALSWLEDMETTGVFGTKAAARAQTPAKPAKPSRAKPR